MLSDGVVINGMYMFINPANRQTMDCADSGLAKREAMMMSKGSTEVVTVYKFVINGRTGGWKPVFQYVDGKRFPKFNRARAAAG